MRPWTRPGYIVEFYTPCSFCFHRLISLIHFLTAICENAWTASLSGYFHTLPQSWGGGRIWECFSLRPFSWELFQNQKINTILIEAVQHVLKPPWSILITINRVTRQITFKEPTSSWVLVRTAFCFICKMLWSFRTPTCLDGQTFD